MAAAVAPEYCKPDGRVNPQVVPVGDHAPLFACRIATQASTVTLVHNADGHGIVPDGFDLKIACDAQFPCTVLLCTPVLVVLGCHYGQFTANL